MVRRGLSLCLHKLVYQNYVTNQKQLGEDKSLTEDDEDAFCLDANVKDVDLYCAALDINSRLRNQGNKTEAFYKRSPLEISSFDFVSALEHIDPYLWKFMFLSTMNASEETLFRKYDFEWGKHIKPGSMADDSVKRRFVTRINTLETSLICILLSASRDVHFYKQNYMFLKWSFVKSTS